MRKTGFTLVEIMISAGLLAFFLTGVMLFFRGGSSSFNTGNWRIQSQKMAQMFLVRLKENLEKANYAVQILTDGNASQRQTMPLYINKRWLNTEATCKVDAAAMWFSITKPYTQGQTSLNVTEKRGRWSGVGLTCRNRVLTLKRSGSITELNNPFGAPLSLPAGPFDAEGREVSFNDSLPDVDSMRINTTQTANGTTVEVILVLRRYLNNQPQETTVRESILCRLLLPDHSILEL